MINIVGSRPEFEEAYIDKNLRILKIKVKTGFKAKPYILMSGNTYESYIIDNNDSRKFGRGKDLIIRDEAFFGHGNAPFDPEIHIPYVAIITYEGEARSCTASDFAKSLLLGMAKNDLIKTDISGKSYGALIGLRALNECSEIEGMEEIINHVYASNPPIFGSPLANERQLKKLLELSSKNLDNRLNNVKVLLNSIKTAAANAVIAVNTIVTATAYPQYPVSDLEFMPSRNKLIDDIITKIVAGISLSVIDPACGSTKENAYGIELPDDRSKFTVFGGSINNENVFNYHVGSVNKEWLTQYALGVIKNIIMALSARYISNVTSGKLSDGTVIYDEERMIREGIKFEHFNHAQHANLANAHYLRKEYEAILKHKEMQKSLHM